MSGAADAFVSHALGLRWDAIPGEAQEAVKTFLLDSLGVGIAGAGAPLTAQVRQAALAWAGAGDANVWGQGSYRTSAANAAFINGFQIHCQEFDCVHEPAVVHPMATILAALMATCDREGDVTGAELGAAIAAAVDVATGLGMAAKTPLKFFRPATAGVFGATLGVARLRGLSEGEARNALGYALSFASGTMQAHTEGKPALPVQIANAARSAVMACDLAAAGMEAAQDSIEGPFGYLTLFEDGFDAAPVVAALGSVFRVAEVSHKPFPTGRAAQGGIVLAKQAKAAGIRPEEIASIVLTAPPLIKRLVGRPAQAGMTASYARLCYQYSGALTLIDGHVGLKDFSSEALARADVAALGAKIEVIDDGQINPAAFTPQVLRIRLMTGEAREFTINSLFGAPADPLTPAQNEAKFRECCAFGFGTAREDIEAAIIAAVNGLENLDDAGRLSRLASGIME
ncbi:MmgE/PrpD family protein [Hyphomonas sp. CACIAM 19H1]|uniref:MmgE/PrpD family protein n=1 Tax=Hyphomonas sp. CACIAM 19H1 TaxID=1873716 RepID=UPI000DEDE3DC|nr:MmgE/PrpD family protein [Hyphomonas sp. CACIAM 19H1]AXE63694.1 MmgE/PrpD family protein [Hyphomonas sp. CACIAM 19H1]